MKASKSSAFLVPFLAAGLAAGCGTVAAASHPAADAGTTAVADPGITPRELAVSDARAILRDFVPPPGAIRLAKRPALPSGSPATGPIDTTVAVDAGYWRGSGDPATLQAWEKAHISRSFSRQDVIAGPPSWSTTYSLPPIPPMLSKRAMNVQFYDAGGGQSVIIAEAVVVWQPPRPESEVIPAAARVVTIARYGPWQGTAPITVTSAAAVRRLAALVDALPLSTVANDVPCPMTIGFTLTFRAAAGGRPVAVVQGPGACSEVSVTINGNGEPTLQASGSFVTSVLQIAGLRWKLP